MLQTRPYELMVRELTKPGSAILATLTPQRAELLHMAMGLAGEVGELVDAIKKHVIYNKELDYENVIEELGDVEFFLEGLRQTLNLQRAQILTANMVKLGARYPQGTYSDVAAKERADKLQAQVPKEKLGSASTPQINFLEQRQQLLEMAFLNLCEDLAADHRSADDIAYHLTRELIKVKALQLDAR